MPAASCAVHFRAGHAVAAIRRRRDGAWLGRDEAGPAGAGIELRVVREQLLPAAGAIERPRALLGVQRATARTLGRVLTQHLILLRRQQRAPLLVGFLDWKICHLPIVG